MRKHLAIAAAAAVLFSCSKSPIPEPEPKPDPTPVPEKWEIKIATSITKVTDSSFENGDKVGIYVVNEPNTLKNSGNHVDNMGFTYSGTWTSSASVYWKDETTKADFYCYYPYISSISSIDALPFEVKHDQSIESGYKSSYFIWGKTGAVAPTKDNVGISVKHSMSNIIIKLVAGTGYTSKDLEAASVKICGLKTKATVNLATGTVTATGEPQEITPLAQNGHFCALVVPQSVSNTEIISIAIGDKIYKLKQSVNLVPGNQHTCTITVEKINQGMNIQIGNWETSDEDFGGTVE